MAERLQSFWHRGSRAGHEARLGESAFTVLRLASWLRQSQPNVVQTWMYHADLLGGIAARLAGKPVIWSIHHTNLEPRQNKRLTIWTARMCARLSRRIPRRIVCVSEVSRAAHAKFGYDDCEDGSHSQRLRPAGVRSRRGGKQSRCDANWASRKIRPLIGMAARFHVQKGHRNFVAAAARLHARSAASAFCALRQRRRCE